MSKNTTGYNGISADMLSAVAQIAKNSSKLHTEQAAAEKEKLATKFESFRPVSADKIERDARPIERLYAGMAPATRTEQKEETIAERVAALKKPTTKHQPMSHDSYLKEPKITLEPKAKRTMEAEEVQLSDEDKAFLASLEVAEGTTPMKPEHKALAKLAEPKHKITHKDVLVGRGVFAKEEKEESDAEEKKEKNTNNPFDWRNYKSAIKKAPGEMTGHDSKKISTGTVFTKKAVKEDTEVAEELDTPGNSTHQCAIHVKHSTLGEGKTLTSQHAEPAEDGSIAWYDVMFAEGIQRVDTIDLEVLVSESHMNHKKKKKAM